MTFDTFLTMAFTSLVSSGLAVFLLKKWVEHSFSARLAKLETENRMRAHEHQVRFTRFDEKLTNAIEGAYELVVKYSELISDVVRKANDGNIEQADEHGLNQAADQFNQFMQRQSIYLPLALADKMCETRSALRDVVHVELVKARDLAERRASGEAPTTILTGLSREAAVKDECNAILLELQEMTRVHLSRFVPEH